MFIRLVINNNRSYRMCVIYLYNTTRRWLISVNKIKLILITQKNFLHYIFTVCFWNTFIHWYLYFSKIIENRKTKKLLRKLIYRFNKNLQHNFQLNIQYFSMLKFQKRSAFYTFSAHQTFICLPINCIKLPYFIM